MCKHRWPCSNTFSIQMLCQLTPVQQMVLVRTVNVSRKVLYLRTALQWIHHFLWYPCPLVNSFGDMSCTPTLPQEWRNDPVFFPYYLHRQWMNTTCVAVNYLNYQSLFPHRCLLHRPAWRPSWKSKDNCKKTVMMEIGPYAPSCQFSAPPNAPSHVPLRCNKDMYKKSTADLALWDVVITFKCNHYRIKNYFSKL